MARDTATRKWQLTINNPIEHGFDHETIKSKVAKFASVEYWCMADEIGLEDGTLHTHVYMHAKNAIMFSTVKKHFECVHIEMCKGTAQDNIDYVAKTGKWLNDKKRDTSIEGTFEEFGERPVERQGKSNLIDDMYSLIKQGFSNFEIMEIDANYGKYFDKMDSMRQMVISERYKETWRCLNVTYVWGDTGSGKTRSIMDHYGYKNVFRVTDYNHPFDNYKGQDVIIFEEYRSSLKIGDILTYLEGYPLELPCRYNNKWACYTKVFVISNIPLGEQYKSIQTEQRGSYEAFVRRFNTVLHYTNGKIEKSHIELMANGFRPILDGEYNAFIECFD